MSKFNTRAVVLRTQDIKENDKLMWLFTEKLGKISCVARGAKRSKNKLFSSCLTFNYGEYMLYKGKSLSNVEECENIESFQCFLSDLDNLAYASYFCELLDIALVDEESNRELFKQFITAMYLLKSNAIDRELLARAFEIKVLSATGYELNLEYYKQIGTIFSPAAYNTMNYLSKIPLDKVHRLTVDVKTKQEVNKVLMTIIYNSYNRKPRSLEILNSL